jgi:hypothetical protein
MTSAPHWTDGPTDAVALIRAQLTDDCEAVDVITAHANQDRLREWLALFARCWLLDACGSRENATDETVKAALDYLDRITEGYCAARYELARGGKT